MKKKFLAPALFLLLGMSMFAYSSSLSAEEKGQTEPTIRLTPGLSHFKALECDIPASIIYTQGDHFDLVIETPIQYEKLLRYMVDADGCLEIESSKNKNNSWKRIKIYITAPSLEEIELNSAVKFSTQGKVELSRLNIDANGACEISIPEIACKNLELEINGASKADINVTQAQRVGIEGNGASKVILNAESELINIDGEGTCSFDIIANSKNVMTELSGVCKMTLTTNSENLFVTTSGVNRVTLLGKTNILRLSSGGLSRVNTDGLKTGK